MRRRQTLESVREFIYFVVQVFYFLHGGMVAEYGVGGKGDLAIRWGFVVVGEGHRM